MTDRERALLKALGREIRYWRDLRGLSREQLAEKVGISPTTMGRIERDGPVDVGDTWNIALALGLGFSELIARAEQSLQLSGEYESLAALDPQPGLDQLPGEPTDGEA